VKAESKSPDNAKTMVQRVLARIRLELESRQTALHAPRETFINPGEVVTPTLPEAQISGKVRAAGAALVLGIAGGLTGAYGAESFLARRRRRADGDDAADSDDAPTMTMPARPSSRRGSRIHPPRRSPARTRARRLPGTSRRPLPGRRS